MRHLDDGTIHAWLDGALDAAAEKKAEEHAARCTQCAVAVADARGLIAASSRILTALDNVPSGVLPRGSRATPLAPRRWGMWTMRIAASVAVVATGTILVTRIAGPGSESRVAGKTRPDLPPGTTLTFTPAVVPETVSERQAAAAQVPAVSAQNASMDSISAYADADKKAKSEEKGAAVASGGAGGDQEKDALQRAQSTSAPVAKSAVTPAPSNELAAAPVQANAPRAEPDSSSKQLSAGVATHAPAMKLEAGAPAAAAGRAAELSRMALPPGVRLLSEQQVTEEAGLVQRRVYEVRPGVDVTLAMLAPAAAPAAAPADGRLDAPPRDSADSARRQNRRVRGILGDENSGINSIQWTDSTGNEFSLSGPLPLDSLRALRTRLPWRQQHQ